jgi:hypothetical protein
MATTQIPASSASAGVRTRPHYRILIRKKWTDNWQVFPYLECIQCSAAAAPTLNKATFRWRYGNIKRADLSDVSPFSAVDLKDQYVRIEVLQPKAKTYSHWVGVFADELLDDRGTGSNSAPLPPEGDQAITAYGLGFLLDRKFVRETVATNDGTNVVKIDAPLAFNQDYVKGFIELGNRTAAPLSVVSATGADVAVPVFSSERDGSFNAFPWTAADIVDYLLCFFGPSDVPFYLGGQTDALEALILPRVEPRGQTVWQILNEIIDRRYGLGFSVRVGDKSAEVHVFTTMQQAIKLDDAVVPGNPNVHDLDLASMGHRPENVNFQADTLNTYRRIVVAGEPILSMFTVSFNDGSLEEYWTDSEEDDYKNVGANLAAGEGTAETLDRLRTSDAFNHVFSTFQIPASWNWLAGEGEGHSGGPRHNANPNPDWKGFLAGDGFEDRMAGAPVRNWGHRLLRSLPLLKPVQLDPADPEYREPVVLIQDPITKKYRHVEHAIAVDDVAGHVRMLDKDFAFEVGMHPQHLLAMNHWDQSLVTQHAPKYDYTTIIATVAARTDTRLSVAVDLPQNDAIDRTLHIAIEDAELWYCVPGTVLQIDPDDGSLVHASLTTLAPFNTARGYVIRDDSPRLRQIAALAEAWYGTPRSSMTLGVSDLWSQYQVGAFIRNVSDRSRFQQVNSVITEIIWDFQTMRTTLRTQFSELDFAGGRRARNHTIH